MACSWDELAALSLARQFPKVQGTPVHHAGTVWEGIEEYARDDWRTPDELLAHLRRWLDRHDPNARAAIDNSAGRYLGFGHGGLLRMPLTGGWQSQGAAGYRTASALLGDRSAVFADPDGAVDATARRHLSAYGPASRHDIAWWSGLGLRVVDSALGRLAGELTEREGPDGRIYHDLLEARRPPIRRAFGCFRSSTRCCAATTPRLAPGSSTRSTTGGCGSRTTGCCWPRYCATVGSPAAGG